MARCRPDQAEGTASKGKVVTWLNAVKILKEPAATGKAVLDIELGLQQQLKRPDVSKREGISRLFGPKMFRGYPSIPQQQVVVAGRPGVIQKLLRILPKHL